MTRQRYDVPGTNCRIIPRDAPIRPGDIRIYRPGKNGTLRLKKVVPFRPSPEPRHYIKREVLTIVCHGCGKHVKTLSAVKKWCSPCAGPRI